MHVIHVIRKPLSGGTLAENISAWGCGALHINGARIPTRDREAGQVSNRWPPNLILQHQPDCRGVDPLGNEWECAPQCPAADMDEQSGVRKSGAMDSYVPGGQYSTYGRMMARRTCNSSNEGTASRFFLQIWKP